VGPNPFLLAIVALALAAGSNPGDVRRRSREGETAPDRLTLERVARYPPPGTRVPGTFRFDREGRYLYYLGLEGTGSARVLYREEVAASARSSPARRRRPPRPRPA
jgi:hypothetical protein